MRSLVVSLLLLGACRFDVSGIRRPEPEDLGIEDAPASFDRARVDRPRRIDLSRPAELALPRDAVVQDRPIPPDLPTPDIKPKADQPKPDTKPKPDLPKPDTTPTPTKTCTQIYGGADRFRLCKELAAQCQFFVNTYSSSHTCQSICTSFGGKCLDGYDAAGYSSSADQCTFSTKRGCADSYYFHICICTRF